MNHIGSSSIKLNSSEKKQLRKISKKLRSGIDPNKLYFKESTIYHRTHKKKYK